jgi:enamine deaminase RidA (YjgF/YER057c/UK114 family)
MSAERKTVPAAGNWGDIVGYSRAVRVGQTIHVAGTTAPGDDVGAQTTGALEIALGAIAELGGTPEDVVRTRLFLTNIDEWEAAGRAHGAIFGAVRPANTMLEVSRLIDPSLLVEVEVEAILPEGR